MTAITSNNNKTYLVSLLSSLSLHPHKLIAQSVKTFASGVVVMGDVNTACTNNMTTLIT